MAHLEIGSAFVVLKLAYCIFSIWHRF